MSTKQSLEDEGISVSLIHDTLDVSTILTSVKSPKAGAIVLFAGTYIEFTQTPFEQF